MGAADALTARALAAAFFGWASLSRGKRCLSTKKRPQALLSR
jgi:hypothetical protein